MSLTDLGGGAFELNQLAVLPECRHCGYSRQLLDFCKRRVLEFGGDTLKLDYIEENTRLKAWYLANGFEHTGTRKFENRPFTAGYAEWRAVLC